MGDFHPPRDTCRAADDRWLNRAVFMTVLHRVMVSGSDRSALRWRRDQAIDATEGLELQHLYRAMGWLGEVLDEREPDAPSPRRTKDLIEEALFARRSDLFTDLDLVFFDTTGRPNALPAASTKPFKSAGYCCSRRSANIGPEFRCDVSR